MLQDCKAKVRLPTVALLIGYLDDPSVEITPSNLIVYFFNFSFFLD